MNILEREMIVVLRELKEKYGVFEIKAEFEAEGSRMEEMMRLKDVTTTVGLPIILKIGGVEAVTDIYNALAIGVKDTLIKLENLNIRNYLVTSKPKLPAEKILDLLNIRDHFADVVCPDSATPAFPSKSIAMACLIAKHGLDCEKILSVGDTNEDKAAAITCGIRFAAACYGYGHFEEDSASIDFKMNTIPDLLEIVRKENL